MEIVGLGAFVHVDRNKTQRLSIPLTFPKDMTFLRA